jgi:hypothetical protein
LKALSANLQKTQDLPTTSELTARAQQVLSKDVTEIKNILAAPISKSTTPSYAQVVKNPYGH